MEMLCHDLKTERRDVSGGLPAVLKIVPVLFYMGVVVCTSGYVWFEASLKSAKGELQMWRMTGASYKQEVAKVGEERKRIEAANKWSSDVAGWLEGAHHLQPLLVALGRGVGQDATISEVVLARNSEIPSQIQFTLKMDGVTSRVLDRTLEGIRQLDFRAYSAQQKKDGEYLDYNAILVYQKNLDVASR